MSDIQPFDWFPLEPSKVECDGCSVYLANYRLFITPRNFLDLCTVCAGRLRMTTKAVQRHIQGAALKKVHP